MIRILLTLFFIVASVVHNQAAVARDAVPIADMKAAYLYNFILYTKWADNPASINLCLYKQAVDTVNVRVLEHTSNKNIKVMVINQMNRAPECQLLYVDEADSEDLSGLQPLLASTSTLLVTSAPISMLDKSMIELTVENAFLSFNVNLKAVRMANIQLSAKLFQFAKQVKTD